MEKYTPLRTLSSPIANEIICVRVTRLWNHRGGTDEGPIKDMHMLLVDGQGDALHAIVPNGFFHQFIDVLHEQNVYEISKFLLVKRQEVMRPVDAPFAIKITRSTVVQLKGSLADALPEWSYSLTPFKSLPVPTVESGCLVDVIGTICGVSDIQSFNLPQHNDVMIKRHVHLRDLSGHKIKIVLWGNCALRFNGNTIRALGQTESAVAIFVGTTSQEYDGERGLAGMAACSWYINEDIVDINIFHASLDVAVQPITNAPLPLLLPRRTQVGNDWPKKNVSQMAAFNFFENKEFQFKCTVTLSRVYPNKRWWYTFCHLCRRLARPTAVDEDTYICSDSRCPSTTASIGYSLTVIGYDQTGEAEFTLLGRLAEQVIGSSIHQLIQNNQSVGPHIVNDTIAAARVHFPPPEVSMRLGNRYRFVVAVTRESFLKPRTTFSVRKVEAVFPRIRPLSSLDTIIPATSWNIDTPMLKPAPSVQNSSTTEPGPSNQVNNTPTNPDSYSLHVMEALDQAFAMSVERADAFCKNAVERKHRNKINEETSAGGTIKTLLGNNYKPGPVATAINRKKRKLVLDGLRGPNGDASHQ